MAGPGFSYEVERVRPADVRDELLRLWRENLKLGVSPDEKFRWLYRDAPLPADSVFVLRARSADGTSELVGANGVAVRRFQLGAATGRAGISGDLAVDAAHRGLLPALRLVREVNAFALSDFDVTYGFPNKKAEGVMVRGGFRVLGKTARYARVLRHASYAARLKEREGAPRLLLRAAEHPALVRAGSVGVDLARLSMSAPAVARALSRYRLVWETRFDERFDGLWERARGEYEIVGERTSAFLAWRCPSPEVATLVRRSGELAAYAVVERDPATGAAHVRDLFGHKRVLGALLDLLLPALWRRRAVSVSLRLLGAPEVVALLEARGFERRAESRTAVVQAGRDAAGERLEDAKRWHLFDVDEDT